MSRPGQSLRSPPMPGSSSRSRWKSCGRTRCPDCLLRHGHQLEDVTVRVLEIDASAAVPVVELAVVQAPGSAAVRDAGRLDAAKDGIELRFADVEGVVV